RAGRWRSAAQSASLGLVNAPVSLQLASSRTRFGVRWNQQATWLKGRRRFSKAARRASPGGERKRREEGCDRSAARLLSLLKISTRLGSTGEFRGPAYRHDMVTILCTLVSIFAFRFRSRASLELRLLALQHQLAVLRRQRPGRPPLSSLDRLLWVWLYRIWPQIIDAMVLVKPATVVQLHRKGVLDRRNVGQVVAQEAPPGRGG